MNRYLKTTRKAENKQTSANVGLIRMTVYNYRRPYRLYSWSEEWLLKLNISKCKVLSITRGTAQDNAYRLNTLGGTCNLEIVEKMKDLGKEVDLGVIVDEKLKFYDHIHERVNKAHSMTLGIIKRNFKYMDKAAFLCLYKGLIRSTVTVVVLQTAEVTW